MINWAHIHLMLNHFPVVGVLGAIFLLLYALLKKSDDVKMVSLGLFVLVALVTLPVYVSGGFAEDAVKNLPGVTETVVGRHAEAAVYALVLMGALGVAAFMGLFILRRSGALPNWIIGVVLVCSLLATAVVGFTANLGGQIRHTEIRTGTSFSSEPGPGK